MGGYCLVANNSNYKPIWWFLKVRAGNKVGPVFVGYFVLDPEVTLSLGHLNKTGMKTRQICVSCSKWYLHVNKGWLKGMMKTWCLIFLAIMSLFCERFTRLQWNPNSFLKHNSFLNSFITCDIEILIYIMCKSPQCFFCTEDMTTKCFILFLFHFCAF